MKLFSRKITEDGATHSEVVADIPAAEFISGRLAELQSAIVAAIAKRYVEENYAEIVKLIDPNEIAGRIRDKLIIVLTDEIRKAILGVKPSSLSMYGQMNGLSSLIGLGCR